MASNGLPSGAFLTTIQGRRCTAVPRIAAVSVDSDSATTATSTTTSARTTTIPNPTTGLAAAPAADIDTSSTGTTSPLVVTTGVPPSPVQIAQAPDSESGSPARPPPPPAALPPAPDATSQPIAALADETSSGASVAESSQADASVTAVAADTQVNSQETASVETSSAGLSEGPAATPLLTTIEPPQTPTETAVPDARETTPADAVLPPISNSNNSAVQSTVAVAGGVIGGIVAISVLAFFIWWWRRRAVRKRRSTLLTPLDAVPSFDRDEKGGYVITRGSIGPTPVSEKFRAALGQNFKKIRGHIRNKTAPSVNLDRGTSQFMDAASIHSRANSSNSGIIGVEPTAKDRFRGWWSGLGTKFGRRNSSAQERSLPVRQERRPALSGQPDFLTLLNMDDGELDREAQRRRASMARRNGSASSADNFLGLKLNFDNDNPFTDANAIARTSAKPAPLAVNQTANPFSDTNAIRDPPPALPKPTTYVADIRRSRSDSTSLPSNGGGRQPSTTYHPSRDSIGSLRSLATATTTNQRNKFRSDPFDLERPELLGGTAVTTKTTIRPGPPPPRSSSISSSTAATAGSTAAAPTPEPQQQQQQQKQPQPPARARTRAESFTSRYSKYSKYSSGISVVSAVSEEESLGGDWSDPGPDVGPAATATATSNAKWGVGVVSDGNGNDGGRGGVVQGWRERLAREREEVVTVAGRGGGVQGGGGGRKMSGGSLGSVGKAM